MTPKRLQGTPLGSTKASERQQKRHLTDTPKEPKLKIENRCNRHRHSDFTNTTLKQHYVENDLGPAECAERLNTAGPLRALAVFFVFTGLQGSLLSAYYRSGGATRIPPDQMPQASFWGNFFSFFQPLFRTCFWEAFWEAPGSILPPFWKPLGDHFASQNRSKK